MLYIKHKDECFIRYPNTGKEVEKNEPPPVFSKLILREKKGKTSPNFMIISLVESDIIFLLFKCYFRELLRWYLKGTSTLKTNIA